MSEDRTEDPLLDSFQQWQLGIALLFLVTFVGGITAILFGALAVPYADGIGMLIGTVLAFLAISYWYYGR